MWLKEGSILFIRGVVLLMNKKLFFSFLFSLFLACGVENSLLPHQELEGEKSLSDPFFYHTYLPSDNQEGDPRFENTNLYNSPQTENPNFLTNQPEETGKILLAQVDLGGFFHCLPEKDCKFTAPDGFSKNSSIKTESLADAFNRQQSINIQKLLTASYNAESIYLLDKKFNEAIELSFTQMKANVVKLLKSKNYPEFFQNFSKEEELKFKNSLYSFIRENFKNKLYDLFLRTATTKCKFNHETLCSNRSFQESYGEVSVEVAVSECPEYRCPEARPHIISGKVDDYIDELVKNTMTQFREQLGEAFRDQIEDFKQVFSHSYIQDVTAIINEMEGGWDQDILKIADSIEGELREITKGIKPSYLDDWSFSNIVTDIEDRIYKEATWRASNFAIGQASLNTLDHGKSLEKSLNDAYHGIRRDPKGINVNIRDLYEEQKEAGVDFYNRVIEEPSYEALRGKLDRNELSLFEKEDLLKEEAPDYEFKSPEGEFLDKNRDLYNSLYQATPHHEQGRNARQLGLYSVKTADELYSEGQAESAELAYQLGESLLDIVLGVIPYVGLGKDVYEAFTGVHLITGRRLSGFERSMAFAGIALSSVSGGALSSGTLKNLNKLDPVIKRIIKKGSYLKDKSYEKTVTLLEEMRSLGVKNLEEFRGAYALLQNSLVEKAPDLDKALSVLKSIGKEGITKYRQVLGYLGENFPEAGKRFLARKLRFYKSNLTELRANSRDYQKYYDNIDISRSTSLDDVTVWRALKKEGVNEETGIPFKSSPEDLFKIHTGNQLDDARYSIKGSEALYTTTTKETALKEALEIDDLPSDYYVGSQKINLDKVLDLTKDSKAFKDLELDIDSITKSSYETTQVIGDIARTKGFKGIKAPLAKRVKDSLPKGEEQFNIVIFN